MATASDTAKKVKLKLKYNDRIRVVVVSESYSFAKLQERLREDYTFDVFLDYEDMDGDRVMLNSQNDLNELLANEEGPVHVAVSVSQQQAPPPPPLPPPPPALPPPPFPPPAAGGVMAADAAAALQSQVAQQQVRASSTVEARSYQAIQATDAKCDSAAGLQPTPPHNTTTHTCTHPAAATVTSHLPQAQLGLIASKGNVYAISEKSFIAKGRSMVAGKGGSRQRHYFCGQRKQGCTAQVRWVKKVNGDWKVSSLDDVHVNCGGATASATLRGVNDIIQSIVQNDLTISAPNLKKAAEAATGSKLSLRSVQRAKQRFGELSEAQEAELMTKLRPYLKELRESSPGTVTDVEADADGAMTRCFVMTGKALHVAQTTGVKVASLDSSLLKTGHRGQLITLGVKDDNNKILLVAAAIVDKEDEGNYVYFLRNCMKSPTFAATFNSADMTIFTDGHKGAPPALNKCLPNVETYRCLQDYLKDAKAAIGSALLKNVYHAARAPTKAQFDSFMSRVKKEKPATYEHLMTALPLSSWTHYACKQDTRIGDTVTSDNAAFPINMMGREVRGKVPLLLVEALVDVTASKCAVYSKAGSTTGELYTPHAVETFDMERALSNGLVVTDYGGDTFKVDNGGPRPGSDTVDLRFGTPEEGGHVMKCTCGFPARHGIPCRHVLAATKYLAKMDIARDLIDDGYNAQKYRAAYANNSFGIRPPSLAALDIDPTLFPPKPVVITAGRPKGGQKRKRVTTKKEQTASSRYNTRTLVPLAARVSVAVAAACASLSQPTPSQPTLSQPTPSQPTSSQPTPSQPTPSQPTNSEVLR